MPDSKFVRDAVALGMDRDLAEFLDERLAKHPHTHEIDDVEGLPETLEELGVEIDEGEAE